MHITENPNKTYSTNQTNLILFNVVLLFNDAHMLRAPLSPISHSPTLKPSKPEPRASKPAKAWPPSTPRVFPSKLRIALMRKIHGNINKTIHNHSE